MGTKRLSPEGDEEQEGIKASPAELVDTTLELDREHHDKLAILGMLSKTPVTDYIQDYIDCEWEQISNNVDDSLTLDDFREIVGILYTKVLFAGE